MKNHPQIKKKYRIVGRSTDYLVADIWASNRDDAANIGIDLPLGSFSVNSGEWEIEIVEEVDDDEYFDPVN